MSLYFKGDFPHNEPREPHVIRILLFLFALLATTLGAMPNRIQDAKPLAAGEQTVVLAGGCFWGIEAVFERLEGVSEVMSGYAGGSRGSAHYDAVSSGTTGHAEAVKIAYDPARISYGQLLKVFFGVAHDPTQLNRQGPDEGPQYRSSIFYNSSEQKAIAEAFIKHLTDAKAFQRRIVTTVVPLEGFYPAEAYHQNFVRRNPSYPYVVYHDLPKLDHLQKAFPELLKRK